ncbi:hypothetical protein H4Q32_028239 [Labeo rohita]|uniref:Uncharacterized protein n=1 Tax=Labeo rohita TaxID=84645 RepID=A0ABQ8LLZ4_LABRO|nr:hypothetical protein H4Q32_028239 [Labeo rohita]
MPQPQKKKPRLEYSAESEKDPTMTTIEVGLLESINNKLAVLEILHQDIKDLNSSLEFKIPEQTQDNPEQAIKGFMHSTVKLPKDTVNNITFHHVHRLGSNNKNLDTKCPRPIVAKFEHYKQKELVKSKGKELRGTTFGLNDHSG